MLSKPRLSRPVPELEGMTEGVCRGELVTNCTGEGWPGPQCFLRGLEITGSCAPASRNVSLGDIVSSGVRLDGQEGALCILDASKSMCSTDLACTDVGTGPLAGSGVGYCAGVLISIVIPIMAVTMHGVAALHPTWSSAPTILAAPHCLLICMLS